MSKVLDTRKKCITTRGDDVNCAHCGYFQYTQTSNHVAQQKLIQRLMSIIPQHKNGVGVVKKQCFRGLGIYSFTGMCLHLQH